MQYQTFPGKSGNSNSVQKLAALRMPSLAGKRFLDVGCNEGFFCGFARYQGAGEVIGIDRSESAIARAQQRFADCTFLNQSWDALPKGRFDVILFASALHYAEDQEKLIHRLVKKLNPDGVLVLEIGIASGKKAAMIEVDRGIDKRLFPTRPMLAAMLNVYAWKVIGHSVNQSGDPVQRFVVHVSPMRPFVYLLMDNPGRGKTTISRTLFSESSGISVISGDQVYGKIRRGQLKPKSVLLEVLGGDLDEIGSDEATRRILASDRAADLVDLWLSQEPNKKDLAIDSYVPEAYHQALIELFKERGYAPVVLTSHVTPTLAQKHLAEKQAHSYSAYLRGQASFLDAYLMIHSSQPEKTEQFCWYLDNPKTGDQIVEKESINFSGWLVALPEGIDVDCLYVLSESGEEQVVFSRRRTDALAHCFEGVDRVPKSKLEKNYGFSFELVPEKLRKEVSVFFDLAGTRVCLFKISLVSKSRLYFYYAKQRTWGRLLGKRDDGF